MYDRKLEKIALKTKLVLAAVQTSKDVHTCTCKCACSLLQIHTHMLGGGGFSPCNSCSLYSHVSGCSASTISKQELSIEKLAASLFSSFFFFLIMHLIYQSEPWIQGMNPAICCDWLPSVCLSGWVIYQDGSSSCCLCVCVCVFLYVYVCACVFPCYCIYTQTVYTTHKPHIDHPLNSLKSLWVKGSLSVVRLTASVSFTLTPHMHTRA